MAAPGDRLAGRYELQEPIGSGGMAIVWRARDLRLQRTVAVKVLRPQFAEDPEFAERFATEARHAGSLAHENVATVYDTGVEGAIRFIVMELVDGPSVADLIQGGGRLPVALAINIAAAAARALAAAHRRGLVHRDVKPGNLLIGRDGRVRLADFGIARALSTSRVTTAGVLLGSGPYMSPEQRRGDEAMAASDLFSLGVVLFEMLHGRLPPDGGSAAPGRMTEVEPAEDLPAGIDAIVKRAIEADPAQRFPSARSFADALDRVARRLGEADPEEIESVTVPIATASQGFGGGAVVPDQVGVASPARAMAGRAAMVGGVARAARSPARTALGPRPDVDRRRRAQDEEPRRRAAPLPVLLGLAALAASAVIAIGLMTTGARLLGGALDATGTPAIGRASTVDSLPSSSAATAFSSPSQEARPTGSPPPSLAPIPTPAASAPPVVGPAPTRTPTPGSTPAGAVTAFYDAVEAHDWDRATALWSARMQRRYPPDQWLVGRFSRTTRIDIVGLRRTAFDSAAGTATVAVTLVEYRSVEPSPRRFTGSWELVRSGGRWLLDEPHF